MNKLTEKDKKRIRKVIKRAMKEYGEVFRALGNEQDKTIKTYKSESKS